MGPKTHGAWATIACALLLGSKMATADEQDDAIARFFRTVLRAAEALRDFRFLLAVGEYVAPESLGAAPPNALVVRWARHGEALAHAAPGDRRDDRPRAVHGTILTMEIT